MLNIKHYDIDNCSEIKIKRIPLHIRGATIDNILYQSFAESRELFRSSQISSVELTEPQVR